MRTIYLCAAAMLLSISCQKESVITPSPSERSSSTIRQDLLLKPVIPLAPKGYLQQVQLLTMMKQDLTIRNYAIASSNLYKQISACRSEAEVRALMPNLAPSIDAVRSKFGASLRASPDRDAVIREAVFAFLPPEPMSRFGPCENARTRQGKVCLRELAADIGLCSFASAGGFITYGLCVTAAGVKGWLCGYEADLLYNECISKPAGQTIIVINGKSYPMNPNIRIKPIVLPQ